MSKYEFKRSLAVVIGINHYSKGIQPLQTAKADAKKLAKILKDDHNYNQVILVTDDTEIKPTRKNLLTLLETTLDEQNLTQSDRLLFYFAGHGVAINGDDGPAGYLVPQDADLKSNDTLIPMRIVYQQLASLKCRHLLVILDCCFAGSFRWSSTRKFIYSPKTITKAHYDRFIKSPAWQAITSSAYNQEAFDFIRDNRGKVENSDHSPFAQALFDALHGKADIMPPASQDKPAGDGVITATELYLYLRESVELDSKELQTPGLWLLPNHDRGEYIFLNPNRKPELAKTPELNQNNNPYRGLKPFEEKNAPFFFGREELVKELAQCLSCPKHRLTIVLGASGSGKSSLVKAGLMAYLREEENNWQILKPMRPGVYPFVALAQALEEITNNPRQTLLENPNTLTDIITTWSQQNPQNQLLLVIDQFEELITLTCQTETVNQSNNSKVWHSFIKVLATVLETCPQFHLIVTLRSDFETRFLDSALSPYWAKARFIVRPMRSDELRKVIVGPASERALTFEPPNLVDWLIDEVGQMPGALPLLSFTLSELYIKLYKAWQEKGKEERTLTIDAEFERQGGVAGSLTSRANQEYANLEDEKLQTTMRRVILRMLTFEGGEVARRQVPDSELVYLDEAENKRVNQVINRLVETRLVVRGQGIEEEYTEPAHDYLVRGWDKLQDWIKEHREELTLQQRLTSVTNDWVRHGKPKNDFLLPDGERLNQLEKLFNQEDNWFNQREIEFIQVSIDYRDLQNRKARERQTRTELLHKANQVEGLLLNEPVESLTQAIQAIGQNQERLPQEILYPLQNSLLNAIEFARESHRLGNELTQYPWNSIYSAVSCKGNYIVAGDSKGKIKLWTLEGKLLKTWNAHNPTHIESITIYYCQKNDEDIIVSGAADQTLRFWNMEGQSIRKSIKTNSIPSSISVSSNGNYIVISDWNKIMQILDHQGNLICKKDSITVVAFNPDGKMIVTGDTNGMLRLWDLQCNLIDQSPQQVHIGSISSVTFSSDGQTIVSGGEDGTVRLWDLQKESLTMPFRGHEEREMVTSVAISPDGQNIISASFDGTLRLWNQQGNPIGRPFIGHKFRVLSVAFSPNGKTIISSGVDGTVRLWNARNELSSNSFKFRENDLFKENYNEVKSLAVSQDGKTIVAGYSVDGTNGVIRLWDLQGHPLSKPFQGHENEVTSVAISPDGQTIISGSWDKTIRLWDSQGNLLTKPFQGHEEVTTVAISPDGKTIVSGSADKTIRLWDLQGNPMGQPFLHQDMVNTLAISPNGKMIVSGIGNNPEIDPDSSKGTVWLWDFHGNLLAPPFQGHENAVVSVVFSPDSRIIVSGSDDGTLRLWDLEGKSINRFFNKNQTAINSVAISPDGKIIASSSSDRTLRFWDLEGNSIGQPFPENNSLMSVTFSPNGQNIISSSDHGYVRLWKAHWKSWLEVGCDRLRYHPIFKNPETEEQKQACQTCHDYVWYPEIGAEKLYQKAKKRFEEGSYEEALSIFNLVIQFDSNHADAYHYKEQCNNQLEKNTKSYEE